MNCMTLKSLILRIIIKMIYKTLLRRIITKPHLIFKIPCHLWCKAQNKRISSKNQIYREAKLDKNSIHCKKGELIDYFNKENNNRPCNCNVNGIPKLTKMLPLLYLLQMKYFFNKKSISRKNFKNIITRNEKKMRKN